MKSNSSHGLAFALNIYAFIADGATGRVLIGKGTASYPAAYLGLAASTTSYASLNIDIGAAPTTPTDGSFWYCSTKKVLCEYLNNVEQTIPGILFTSTADATVTNTVIETTIIGSGVGTTTLPGSFFAVGKTIRITVRGKYSDAIVPGTLNIKIKYGTTVLLTTGAQTPTGTLTNEGFEVSGIITCRTTGATGTVYSQGDFINYTAATTHASWEMTNTAATTIDTTASAALDVTVTWGTADAGNTITSTNVILEVLN